ncbi:TetR/AcrR family transcriptional regulator [Pseudoduganella namucuonensis]|uniref:Transcriptional regulator, TetR family n=1 Tax=Pseudoduganella namucuonensis TaxID=1035707 RepID=A0A1I7LRQ6_9BURK|nr:TetR/AcrR family transcriptional regulator [Pseudoduganella namucuonensis]SFV12386.1 transcriptional regulator, TetR family [Pseudoduganella namucuonensis]
MQSDLTVPAVEPKPVAKAATPRKRGKQAADTIIPRERILHAAASLFHERGYQGTTVRHIADAVGILSGSLFYHFRSKEDMLLEIMREAALGLCLRAEDVARGTDDPAGRLRQIIDIELEWMVSDIKKDYLAVLVFEWREVPAPLKAEFTRLRARYNGIWIDALESHAQLVPLRVPVDAAARILHGALMGAMTWFRSSGRYSAPEFRDMLLKLVEA